MRRAFALVLLSLLIPSTSFAAGTALKNEKAAQPDQPVQKREKVFGAETFTLDNGMLVVVIPNHRTPVVTHMVWYKVGAADEPRGQSGIAHFLEHLMFKGSSQVGGRDLAPGEFSKIVRAMGGNDNAFTSQDYTAFFQSVPADRLETVMRMEAGRMNGMNPPPDEVLSERKVILEERKMRTDNDPRGQFGEQMSAVAFINDPYGIPVIGWKHEMDELTYDQAKDFYNRWYAPNNAILVVSGDVTPAEVFDLAIDIYGTLPREDIPKRSRTRSPALNSTTTVTLKHPSIREAMAQTLYRVPSAHEDKQKSLAFEVLEEIMGGGPTSRLYKSLVVEQKIASNAGMSYQSASWNDSSLWVFATPLPDKSLREVHEALLTEIRKLVKDGVSDNELRDAKNRMQDQAIYARDSLTGPAMAFGYGLVTGSSIDDIEYWPYDIQDVTAEQVRAVAAEYLDPDGKLAHQPVDGYLLPLNDEEATP